MIIQWAYYNIYQNQVDYYGFGYVGNYLVLPHDGRILETIELDSSLRTGIALDSAFCSEVGSESGITKGIVLSSKIDI